jgi:sortase (surface protein transpeptidase)
MYLKKSFILALAVFTAFVGALSLSRTIVFSAEASTATLTAVTAQPPALKIEQNMSGQTVPQIIDQVPFPSKQTIINNPTHLAIPGARVDAHVIPVGVTKTNNLDVPPNFVQVGWYEYGAKPGQVGNAVLDGHVDNGGSVAGVFKHLRDLKPGDDVYVSGGDGSHLHFKVQRSDVYLTSKFPSDVVFNQNDGQPILKIITCHGSFVPSTGTYDHRLVVTAVLVN